MRMLRSEIIIEGKPSLLEWLKFFRFLFSINPLKVQPMVNQKSFGKPMHFIFIPKIIIKPPSKNRSEGGDPISPN